MTAPVVACATCGTQRRDGDKFCHECGAPAAATKSAEYKKSPYCSPSWLFR